MRSYTSEEPNPFISPYIKIIYESINMKRISLDFFLTEMEDIATEELWFDNLFIFHQISDIIDFDSDQMTMNAVEASFIMSIAIISAHSTIPFLE